jgi:hypothetical protein
MVARSPVLIYLDTMDYSRFADIGHRNVAAGTESALAFLREKVALGLIAVRYSYWHIMELLKNPDERVLALRKVQFIDELCGTACFRYTLDTFAGERKALASGADPQSQVISDEGEWYPETDVDEETAADLKRVSMQLNSLPPAQRRAILKKMSAKMPLSGLYESSAVQELLAGGGDPGEFHRTFTKCVAGRPRVFIEHYLEGNALARKIFEDFAAGEKNTKELLEKQREALLRLRDAAGGDAEARRRLRQARLTPSGSMGVEKLPNEVREQLGNGQYLAKLPATSTFLNVMVAYLRRTLSPSHSMPVIKESDVADIFHSAYLPYVDFYRTDVGFSDILSKIPRPPRCAVVPRLADLPELVEARLNY